ILLSMSRIVLSVFLGLAMVCGAVGQDKPAGLPSNQPHSQGFIIPSDVNVRVESDVRTLVMMAAINLAGFDTEITGEALSPLRAEVRKDMAKGNPELRGKLTAFYKAHRRAGVEEVTDAARYAALSLLMTPPPSFSIQLPPGGTLPEELKDIADFE